jgi:hypothetical protein
MTPELARAALEFLKRTELRGVECFVMHALLQELERDASQRMAADRPPNGADYDVPMRVTGGAAE